MRLGHPPALPDRQPAAPDADAPGRRRRGRIPWTPDIESAPVEWTSDGLRTNLIDELFDEAGRSPLDASEGRETRNADKKAVSANGLKAALRRERRKGK